MSVLSNNLFVNDTVNVGSDNKITIKELAIAIKQVLGSSSKIKYIDPLKDGDMSRRQPDISKMRTYYKNDFINIESGIKYIFDLMKK